MRTSNTAADVDKRVRGMLASFYGYHQGPPPRLGARVKCQGAYGHVIGHDMGDRVFILLDNGRKTQRMRRETMVSGGRKPLREALEMLTSTVVGSLDTVALAQLLTHFRGDNGARYSSRQAFLWCVHALCHVRAAKSDAHEVAIWLNTQLKSERDGEQLPPSIDTDLLDQSMGSLPSTDSLAELKAIARLSVQRALEFGQKSIELSSSDEAQEVQGDGLERCLAVDLQTENQVVVIGRSTVSKVVGHVDVIDMDTLWSFTRHVSGLELVGDALDAGWFWDVVTQAAIKKPTGPAAAWFSLSLCGPDGSPADIPERRLVAALGSLIALRYAAGQGSTSAARQLIKGAKGHALALNPVDYRRLVALAPELVTPATGKALRLSDIDTLAPAMSQGLRCLLQILPPPEIQPSPLVEALSSASAGALPIVTDQTAPRVPATRPEKIRFARATQPLRFNVTDHQLLAMEWQLVEKPAAHTAAVATTLGWLEQRLGTSLPKTWREGAHEVERAGVALQIESADSLFAFRLEHPDTEHPTRWWRVEATVLSGHGDVGGMVGVRMQARDFVDLPPPHPSIPALVRSWALAPGLLLAGARGGLPTKIETNSDVERAVRIISRKDRESPVLVTSDTDARLPLRGPLVGLARVLVASPLALAYESRYGKLLPGTIHMFPPRSLRPELFIASGPNWLEQLRVRVMAMRQSPETPSFREVRDTIHAHRLQKHSSAAEPTARADEGAAATPPPVVPTPLDPHPDAEMGTTIAASELMRRNSIDQEPVMSVSEIRQLVRREVRDYEEILEVAELERDQALVERDSASAEAIALRHFVEQLQSRLAAAPPMTSAAPATLAELREWAHTVAPRLLFADKALRHAADCNHNEVPKIYASLQAMYDLYWPMRFDTDDGARSRARDKWDEFLQAQRLRWSPIGKAANMGRYEDEYKATVDGQPYTASMHLAGNSTTDPLRCLRVYVEVDDDHERIVVVHLPTHLTNTLT